MNINLDDTIAAISTALGEGAIGIVRLSGADAINIADQLFKPAKTNLSLDQMDSHTVHYGHAVNRDGSAIDEVMAVVFRAPQSFTREHVVEIHAHGSAQSLRAILQRAMECGARHAEPGEFTKRAFLNGRIDLAQAEAVLDMIRAKTDRSLKTAMSQLEGRLSREVRIIKENLMKMYAHMEAFLDFPDEHLEVYSNAEHVTCFDEALQRLDKLIVSYARGQICREGALAILTGRPNVGKSSLLNALLDKDRAIVSDVPGTTRDALEESINLKGVPVRIVDTAGIWTNSEPLTQAAIEKTKQYLAAGDVILYVVDAATGVTNEDLNTITELSLEKKIILIVNKIDLVPSHKMPASFQNKFDEKDIIRTSAKNKTGLDALENRMSELLTGSVDANDSVMITRTRHREALQRSLDALQKARESFLARESLEFVTVDLKRSLDELREMIGELYSEDLLDVIFREFCIGK